MDYKFEDFLETPIFPPSISCSSYATVSPSYKTVSVTLNNGFEQRNRVYINHLKSIQISGALRTINYDEENLDEYALLDLSNFFHAIGGDYSGFRVKVLTDYLCNTSNGYLEDGFGTGKPTYQLSKKYQSGSAYVLKPIKKPNPDEPLTVIRNGVNCVVGTSAGQIQIDFTKGIITFKANKQFSVGSISIGANCVVTTGQNHTFIVGEYVYLSGLGSNSLNNNVYQITAVTSNTFTLGGVTNLATAGGGLAGTYPQPSEPLRWSGEFHHPMRLVGDFLPHFDNDGMIQLETISLQELRL